MNSRAAKKPKDSDREPASSAAGTSVEEDERYLLEAHPPRKNKPLFLLSAVLLGAWFIWLAVVAYFSQQ